MHIELCIELMLPQYHKDEEVQLLVPKVLTVWEKKGEHDTVYKVLPSACEQNAILLKRKGSD